MKTSTNGRKFIEKFEGLILKAYDDANDKIVEVGQASTGTLTIGYGHTSTAGAPRVFAGQEITQAQADQILAADLSKVEVEVSHLVKVPLTQNQFDALVSFQFNTGALGKSSALKYLNASNYTQAAENLTLYNRANGAVMNGLVRRRADEKALFLSKSVPAASTSTAGAIVIGGAATAAATPHHMWPWIIAGTLIAAITVGTVVHFYKNRKKEV